MTEWYGISRTGTEDKICRQSEPGLKIKSSFSPARTDNNVYRTGTPLTELATLPQTPLSAAEGTPPPPAPL